MSEEIKRWVMSLTTGGLLILSEIQNIEFLNNVVLFIIISASTLSLLWYNDTILNSTIEKMMEEKRILASDFTSVTSGVLLLILLVGFNHYIVAIFYALHMVAVEYVRSEYRKND